MVQNLLALLIMGNGVYYFGCAKATFGNSLSRFIASHPNLTVVAIAGDDTSGYGVTKGYFVVFSK